MMNKLSQILVILALTQACLDTGLAIRLELKPHYYDDLMLKAVNVTCRTGGKEQVAKEIINIQIIKEDGTHIASLHHDSELFINKDHDLNITAVGTMGNDNLTSYLTASVYSVIGKYACVVNFFDTDGFMQEERDTGHFDIGEQDVGDVFRYMMNHIIHLERRPSQLEEKDLLSVGAFVIKQFLRLLKLNPKNCYDNGSSVATICKMPSTLAPKLKLECLKETFISAFSAGITKDQAYKSGSVVVFGNVIMDIGGDYDPVSGVFTAPRTGLYVFHLAARSDSDKAFNVDLVANNKKVASLDVENQNKNDQSSVSTVVQLEAGWAVKPVLEDSGSKPFGSSYEDHYTIFTGYILKAY